jgi:hypothetical protein
MKIFRSTEVESQLADALPLRAKLIEHLVLGLKSDAEKSKKNKSDNSFLQTIELSAEGFAPELTRVAVADVDRTVSMLAGPFYTNMEYPIPCTSMGMLLPVVQLELRELSELSGRPLGDGLLQLWCDPEWTNVQRGLIRVIPRDEVSIDTMTSFDYIPHPTSQNSPIPDELRFDLQFDSVQVVSGFNSIGLQCQTSYLLEVYGYDVPEEILNPIVEWVERFEELTECKSNLHVLGSFYPIQYSAVDVGASCLINLPNWGSSGSAQVMYELHDDDAIGFSFEESLR